MADSRAMRADTIEPEIRRFIEVEQYSLAVILSQTLLELLIERQVRELAEGIGAGAFGEATLELLGSFNLNRRTQRFFEHALDLRLVDEMAEQLHALRSHNRLRNRIVHEGASADREEAVDSLDTVLAVTSRLHELVRRRTGRDPEAAPAS